VSRRFVPTPFRGAACALGLALTLDGCERAELLGVLHTSSDAGEQDPLIPDQPRPVPVLNDLDARDTDPTFTEDLTELYFMSDRTGDKRIWRSLRPTPDDPWDSPALVEELNTAGENENPFVSNDGLSIWFFTDRDRSISSQWRSTRPSREDPWGAPAPVEGLVFGEESSDVSVAVDPSETLFILNAKPTGPPPYRLYRLERETPSDPIGAPELMEDVVSDDNEYDPDLRRDGLFLAFDSARAEPRQIYWTRRDDRSSSFEPPVPVPALVSEFSSEACAFSEDLRYVMFSSNRSGNTEIYEARLSTPLF
jgi:Tol biopolymer transport system component